MKNRTLVILIFCLLIFGGAVGAAAYYTQGSFDFDAITSAPKVAGMYCNGITLAAEDTVDMSSGAVTISSEEAFTVKIVVNPECNFDFYLDGQMAWFTGCENDFMPAFNVTSADNSITLAPPVSMWQALTKAYPENKITKILTTIDIEKSYFIAIVHAANGNTYNIYLKGAVRYAEGSVIIDPPEVEF